MNKVHLAEKGDFMRILWLCNTPLPAVARRFGASGSTASWLVGISDELKKEKECELCIVFPQSSSPNDVKIHEQGIYYVGLHKKDIDTAEYSSFFEEKLQCCVREWKPDIIHIFGTEYTHTLEMIHAVRQRAGIVVSIQGLISVCALHYNDGIAEIDRLRPVWHKNAFASLSLEQKEFARRGKNEVQAIRQVKHVIGRTDFDYACVKRINPECIYHKCNETMRDAFYHEKWDVGTAKRHSVFISQGSYPVKGLHYMVKALALIRKNYPDCMVTVAGSDDFIKGKDKTPYGRYIERLIGRYHLQDNIRFLGYHSEKNMVSRLLESHVHVSCSNIENSPNCVGEAMLVGTPTVAAMAGGMASLLEHGTEGFLYQHNAPYMLAYYIQKIFESDGLAMEISEAGRKKAGILYNAENNRKVLLGIYQDIVNEA